MKNPALTDLQQQLLILLKRGGPARLIKVLTLPYNHQVSILVNRLKEGIIKADYMVSKGSGSAFRQLQSY